MGIKRIMIDTNDTEFMEIPIKDIFIGDNRSINCLLRGGIETVGDLVNSVEGTRDLLKIRNCGEGTANKIMQTLFDSYLEYLEGKGKLADYLFELAEIN